MKTRLFDLLDTNDTNLVGELGEFFARQYLLANGIATFNWDASEHCLKAPLLGQKLTDRQRRYLDALRKGGETWSWDFVGVRWYTSDASRESYLIEVKTNRPGKRKHGLKGSSRRKSKRAIATEDLRDAKAVGFRSLLVNVALLNEWQVEITVRDLLAERDKRFKNIGTHQSNG